MKQDTVDLFAMLGFGAFGVFVLFLFSMAIAMAVASASTKAFCLEHGYAEHSVAWNFDRYCVQRDYRGVMKAIPVGEIQ